MTRPEFRDLLRQLSIDEIQLNNTKGADYSAESDVLDNFKRLSGEIDISMEKVLWVYMKKHLDAVRSWIGGKVLQSESFASRIQDIRLYLALLLVMYYEEEVSKEKSIVEAAQAVKEPEKTDGRNDSWKSNTTHSSLA